ncbi:MAG: PaaI family thioesterase [Actinoallomurus sp.]
MSTWTEHLDEIKAGEAERPPVVEILRLPSIVSWRPGQVVTKWDIDEDFFTVGGQLFGGYISAIADQVMGHTAMTVLDDGEMFRTIQMNVTFYRPMHKGVLWITGKVTQKTHQAIHANVEFSDVGGTLMCSVAGIQTIFPENAEPSPAPMTRWSRPKRRDGGRPPITACN